MSDGANKRRKEYVDHTNDGSKNTCLIHGPGNLSDECRVLGKFGSKYYKSRPTKTSGQEPANRKKLNINQEKNDIVNNAVHDILLKKNKQGSSEEESN